MRLFVVGLLLVGCAQNSWKYKYSSSKRYLASLTRAEAVVSKITVELKHPVLFASGMDSTFLYVKLYDDEGNLLTDIDPHDLTLSTNVDIEAKPFVLKQGTYRAQLLPRIKSPSITLKVDWQEKVASREITLRTRISPARDSLTPIQHDYWETKVEGELSLSRGSQTSQESTENFSFDNVGSNRIVRSSHQKMAQRNFSFDYSEQARQNLSLVVDDAPGTATSTIMHSLFMFFPRKQLFTVEQLSGTIDVTLPTGEKVSFAKDSKEIVSGVLKEGPLGSTFPDLQYQGQGVLLRANAQGDSPELAEGKGKIDLEHGLRGSEEVLIINGMTQERCRRPKTDFWENIDVSPIEFKFPTDEAFELYLREKCGFGIPKF